MTTHSLLSEVVLDIIQGTPDSFGVDRAKRRAAF
jgi:hypothetical protein